MRFMLVVLFAISTMPAAGEDPLWSELNIKTVAGPDAIDCGAIGIYQSGMPSSRCVIDAFRQRKPFFVVYWQLGVDSYPGRALAGDAAGRVFEFNFDFGLSVEPNPHRHVESKQCPEPAHLVMSRTGRLSCEQGHFQADVGLCGPVPLRTSASSLSKYKGKIVFELVAHREGNASVLSVSKSEFTPEINDAALAEVREWRFSPALKDGTPVSVRMSVTLSSDGTRETVALSNLLHSAGCQDSEARIVRP